MGGRRTLVPMGDFHEFVGFQRTVDAGFERYYLQQVELNDAGRWTRRFVTALHGMETAVSLSARRSVAVLGTRYPDMIAELRASVPVVILARSMADIRWARANGLPVVPLLALKAGLARALVDPKSQLADAGEVARVRRMWSRQLRLLAPMAVVTTNAGLPLERLVLWSARGMGIPTFEIQHGVILRKKEGHHELVFGDCAQVFLAWGQDSAELVASGVNPPGTEFVAAGLPFVLPSYVPAHFAECSIIGFAGQPVTGFDASYIRFIERLITGLVAQARLRGLRFQYRPHPAERGEYLPRLKAAGVEIMDTSESLHDWIAGCRVVLSVGSTVLLEASLMGCPAVQVIPAGYPLGQLDELGAAYTVILESDEAMDEWTGTFFDLRLNAYQVARTLVVRDNRPASEILRRIRRRMSGKGTAARAAI